MKIFLNLKKPSVSWKVSNKGLWWKKILLRQVFQHYKGLVKGSSAKGRLSILNSVVWRRSLYERNSTFRAPVNFATDPKLKMGALSSTSREKLRDGTNTNMPKPRYDDVLPEPGYVSVAIKNFDT